ncbi:hypothetical protein NMC42_05940 [Pseudomonas aeruginosa]
MAANWGLRGKSVVALLLACALALVPAVLLGWRAMDDIRTHFGLAYAKNFTLLHRQKILAPVSRELALSRRFAESVVTRDWLLKEDDPARRALFFREAEGYRGDFRDHAYFIIASGSTTTTSTTAANPTANGRATPWRPATRKTPGTSIPCATAPPTTSTSMSTAS